METSHKKKAVKNKPQPLSKTPASPAEPVHSDDVEEALGHGSSPFRWELLEDPQVQPNKPLPKKSIHQK